MRVFRNAGSAGTRGVVKQNKFIDGTEKCLMHCKVQAFFQVPGLGVCWEGWCLDPWPPGPWHFFLALKFDAKCSC